MARQLSFDLPALTVLGRADFYVAPSNALAVAMIESTETWPAPQLTVCGPEGAGKTHLANVWANMTGAVIVPSRDLPGRDIPTLAEAPVAVEDVKARYKALVKRHHPDASSSTADEERIKDVNHAYQVILGFLTP